MNRTFAFVVGMAAVYSLLFVQAQMHRMGGAVIAPALSLELHLSASDLGLIIGSMFFASAATQPVSGVLLDRFGPVWAVAVLTPLAVIGMLLFAWSDDVTTLTIARAMIGSGFGCVVSGLYVFLLGWVDRKNFTTAAATIQALPGTASVLIASTPLAILLAEVGRGPVFTGLAVMTVVIVILVSLVVREGPLSTRKNRAPESVLQSFGGILTIVRQRRFLWLAAFSITAVGPAVSVIGLLSGVYLRGRFHLDATQLGNAVMALLIALNLGGVIYGPLDRWTGRRKLVVAGGVLTQVTMLTLLACLPGLGFWPTLALLTAFASVSQLHALVIAHAQSLFGPELAGRVITTTNIFMIGGIFVFQVASGAAYDVFTHTLGASSEDGYRLTFAALACCQIIGLLFYSQAPNPLRPKLPR
ncbi:MAG: MFS transporter [Alphaproteobacteria bacterium]|nr:MFS transporter [Alphaproteobacteria bacterium]MCB9929261.1 MFS transporter [Alphaproteobacteria bacterium]